MRRAARFALSFALSFALLFALSFALSFAQTPPARVDSDSSVHRAIDPAKSTVRFSIAFLFFQHVTGTVPILSGTLTFDEDSPTALSASAVLDATKLTTGDRDQTNALHSSDFFDVARFPEWTFTSTLVTPHGPAAFGVDGMLTIHGVSQPEHLEVTVVGDAAHRSYHAVGHVDRHAFGMSVTRIDPAIGGSADVILDVTLK
ncbi:MAG: YceI family protein [Candidatus Velthaea sp.]|jgi:polyisoprenoid-binding protein YceI